MQRHLCIVEKVFTQLGKHVTMVMETVRDLLPLTQIAWLRFARS